MSNPAANQRPVAKLALEDGTVYQGYAFGRTDLPEPVTGEVVFNTSLTGYQEILTDPSYTGQLVTMTYPHIGNYGANTEDPESDSVKAAGLIVRELTADPSNFRSTDSLDDYLKAQNVLGITGIDTRSLTRKIRITGAMRGVLSTSELDNAKLVQIAKNSPEMAGQNLARVASPKANYNWDEKVGFWTPIQGRIPDPDKAFNVVTIDSGIKSNILRHLAERNCKVTVVPYDASAEDILALNPDGLFVSNGPGDPEPVTNTIATLKDLHGKMPMFGICLGHQLLSLSLGANTFKLRFGHRGGNQPVQNLATGKVEITSQNHGFAVDIDSLRKAGGTPTHINMNDDTLEGFQHSELPIFAVQYHPEAAPGPHDATYLFDCFIEMMKSGQAPTAEQMDNAQQARNNVSAGV